MSEATAPQTIEERLQWLCDNGDKWQRKAESAEADANRLAEALEALMLYFKSDTSVPVTWAVILADSQLVIDARKALGAHKKTKENESCPR